jgi:hypothetical protein
MQAVVRRGAVWENQRAQGHPIVDGRNGIPADDTVTASQGTDAMTTAEVAARATARMAVTVSKEATAHRQTTRPQDVANRSTQVDEARHSGATSQRIQRLRPKAVKHTEAFSATTP